MGNIFIPEKIFQTKKNQTIVFKISHDKIIHSLLKEAL